MVRWRCVQVILLVAVGIGLPLHNLAAGEKIDPVQPKRSRSLLTTLGTQEYCSVPINLKDPLRPIVRAEINNHPAAFLLDTAATQSSLYRHIVDELKLPTITHDQIKFASPDSSGVKQEISATIKLLTIGEAHVRQCQMCVDDSLTELDRDSFQKTQQLDPFSGIFGVNMLTPNRALIDITDAKLFLHRQGATLSPSLADDLSRQVKSEGYREISCDAPAGKFVYLKCKMGDSNITLILDTGSRGTVFDLTAAQRIGIKIPAKLPSKQAASIGRKSVTAFLPTDLKFTNDFVVPASCSIGIDDFAVLNRGLQQQNLPQTDGVLGMDVLRHFSAIIDYVGAKPRLFFIDPHEHDFMLLDGEWENEMVETNGNALPDVDARKHQLVIEKRQFKLQRAEERFLELTFGDVYPGPPLKWFDLTSSDEAGKRWYQCIYEVSRDRLRICMPLEVKPGEKIERPKGFKSAPGSPYTVLTFRRAKTK